MNKTDCPAMKTALKKIVYICQIPFNSYKILFENKLIQMTSSLLKLLENDAGA